MEGREAGFLSHALPGNIYRSINSPAPERIAEPFGSGRFLSRRVGLFPTGGYAVC